MSSCLKNKVINDKDSEEDEDYENASSYIEQHKLEVSNLQEHI